MKKKSIWVSEELIEASDRFVASEAGIDEYVTPALRGLEPADWDKLHSLMRDVVLEGHDIAKRIHLYCDIGHLEARVARRLANAIDDHNEDLALISQLLTNYPDSAELQKLLSKHHSHSKKMVKELRALIYKFFI